MKLTKNEFETLFGLDVCKAEKLFDGLDDGSYTCAYACFPAIVTNNVIVEVDATRLNWNKSSRRFCEDDGLPIINAEMKLEKAMMEMAESEEKFSSFVLGFLQPNHSFKCVYIVERDTDIESLIDGFIELASEEHIKHYKNSNLSTSYFKKDFYKHFDGAEKFNVIADKICSYLSENFETIQNVKTQTDVRSTSLSFRNFLTNFVDSLNVEYELAEIHTLIDQLFKLQVVTMMYQTGDAVHEDIIAVIKHYYPDEIGVDYERLVHEHGDNVKVLFEFKLQFIKGFQTEI